MVILGAMGLCQFDILHLYLYYKYVCLKVLKDGMSVEWHEWQILHFILAAYSHLDITRLTSSIEKDKQKENNYCLCNYIFMTYNGLQILHNCSHTDTESNHLNTGCRFHINANPKDDLDLFAKSPDPTVSIFDTSIFSYISTPSSRSGFIVW